MKVKKNYRPLWLKFSQIINQWRPEIKEVNLVERDAGDVTPSNYLALLSIRLPIYGVLIVFIAINSERSLRYLLIIQPCWRYWRNNSEQNWPNMCFYELYTFSISEKTHFVSLLTQYRKAGTMVSLGKPGRRASEYQRKKPWGRWRYESRRSCCKRTQLRPHSPQQLPPPGVAQVA